MTEIKDNGVGVKEENVDKVFNPFFLQQNHLIQGLHARMELSLCYKIIGQQHGGAIYVSNQEVEE